VIWSWEKFVVFYAVKPPLAPNTALRSTPALPVQ